MYATPARPVNTGRGMVSWAVTCLSVGVVLVAGGVVLMVIRIHGATVAQLNNFCKGGIGQFAQAVSSQAAHDCGWAMTADDAIGWLIGGGIIGLVLGGVLLAVYNRGAAPRPPVPTARWPTNAPYPPAGWQPPGQFCSRCGQPLARHTQGRCPAQPSTAGGPQAPI